MFLLATPLSAFSQQDRDAAFRSLLDLAQQAQAGKDYISAANSYSQAVKLRSDIPELWANLGLMQHEAGEFNAAILSFEHALRLKPSLYVPTLFLGIDYLRIGNAGKAIPNLLRAETMNATDPLPSTTLGRAYSSQQKYTLAARAFERAVRLDPSQSSAWFGLGIVRLDQVEQDARHLSGSAHESSYAKVLFAQSLAKQTRYKEAVDLYKSALVLEPRPPCIHAELGFLALRQHNAAEAAAEFEADLQASPACALAKLGQARLDVEASANDEAVRLLNDLWTRDPGFLHANVSSLTEELEPIPSATFQQFLDEQNRTGNIPAELYHLLSAAFAHQSLPEAQTANTATKQSAEQDYLAGRYAQCANTAKASLNTKVPSALQTLAACAFFTGNYELASQAAGELFSVAPQASVADFWSIQSNERLAFTALEKFQQLEPNSARSHLLLGDIYRQRTRYDDAKVEYQKALDINPGDPAALLGLASAFFGNAQIQQTIDTAKLALRKTPDDPELNLLMAEALIARHQFGAAEPFLEQALHAKPQMLPHIHALLGEVYADAGKDQQAIEELNLGIDTDQDGTLHYQLARLYRKSGNTQAATHAIEQMKIIQQQRRQRAVIAVEDSHSSSLDQP